jgi:putative membrane protein
MSPRSVIILVAALAFPLVAFADNKRSKLNESDLAVLDHHHHTNLIEIEMGRLAEERGSPAVKKYGAMLIKDHATADKNATQLGRSRGITLDERPMPAIEMSRHDDHMKKMEQLRRLEGAAFDREFLTAMADGHTKELGYVTSALAGIGDPKLKAHMTRTKASVAKHADAARALLAPAPIKARDSAVQPEAKHRQ